MCEVLSGHLRYCIQQPRMCVTKERRIISPHASGLGSDRRTPTETDQAKPASLKGALTDRIPFKCLYSLDWGRQPLTFAAIFTLLLSVHAVLAILPNIPFQTASEPTSTPIHCMGKLCSVGFDYAALFLVQSPVVRSSNNHRQARILGFPFCGQK